MVKGVSNRGDAGDSCYCLQNVLFLKIFEFFNNVVLFDVVEAFHYLLKRSYMTSFVRVSNS